MKRRAALAIATMFAIHTSSLGCGARESFSDLERNEMQAPKGGDAAAYDSSLPSVPLEPYRPYVACGILNSGADDLRVLAFSPDGATLLATDDRIRIWNTRSLNLERTLDVATNVAALSADGAWIASAGPKGKGIYIWQNGTVERTFAPDETIVGLAISRDGSIFAATQESITWYGRDGVTLGRIPNDYMRGVVVSPDASFVIPLSIGPLRVLRVSDGKTLLVVPGDVRSLNTAAFIQDSTVIVTLAFSGEAQFFQSKDGSPTGSIAARSGSVRSVAASADGRLIAIGDGASQVTIGRVDDRVGLQVITTGDPASAYGVNAIAFSRDATMIATATPIGKVRLWCAK